MEFQEYEIINGRKVVKKHVAAIHCSGKLTLMERKIANVLLYKALPELSESHLHHISLEELKRLLGLVTRNHELLKKSIKTLISTVIEWNLCGDNLPEEVEGWSSSSFLAGVSIKQGLVTYQYSEAIKTLLANPEIYGQVNLAIQARFKSSYALALYENCSRYRKVGMTKKFELDLFRELMGVKEGTYQQFDQLKKRVITQAVNEINTSSDIRINTIYHKRGRKVIALQFEIEEQKIMKRLGAKKNKSNEINVNDLTLDKFVKKYGEDKVERSIKYIQNTSSYKEGKIKNINGYLNTILKEAELTTVEKDHKKCISLSIEEIEMQKQLNHAIGEFNHWKQLLERAKSSNNDEQIKFYENELQRSYAKLNDLQNEPVDSRSHI